MEKLGKELTWDDLANAYDSEHNGTKARVLPMDKIFDWAEKQKKRFKVTKDGTIHRIIKAK